MKKINLFLVIFGSIIVIPSGLFSIYVITTIFDSNILIMFLGEELTISEKKLLLGASIYILLFGILIGFLGFFNHEMSKLD